MTYFVVLEFVFFLAGVLGLCVLDVLLIARLLLDYTLVFYFPFRPISVCILVFLLIMNSNSDSNSTSRGD